MAKKETTVQEADTTAQVPSTELVTDLESFSGKGFENQTHEDYTLPWLNLLQKDSPEVEPKDPKYIEEAKVGDYCNTVLRKVYSGEKGFTFIPCTTNHVYVEWVPRNSGGGFVAVHELNSPVVQKAKAESKKFGKYTVKVGEDKFNDLVETFYIYGITCEGNVPGEPFVMPFTSTKIKQYKDHMAAINSLMMPKKDGVGKFNPPMFCNRLFIKSMYTQNDKGKFYVPVVAPAINNSLYDSCLLPDRKPEDVQLYLKAKKFYDSFVANEIKVDYSQQQDGGSSGEEASPEGAPF